MAKKQNIIAIVGPTSSGKTAFAITLAKKLNGEVISVDSRQVYTGLNLGTGKVTKREMAGVPHHLLNVASPKQVFSVSDYVPLARAAIADILSRGKVPILCGGTGLYLDATLGRVSIPEVPPNPALRKQLAKRTAEQLFAQLQKLDKRRAQEIDRHNPVRLIRAIEIAQALGKVPVLQKAEIPYQIITIGLKVAPLTLQKRIHTRLVMRMKAGMLREAKHLHTQGISWKRMEELGLEYRFMARHLQGKMTKVQMLKELEQEIGKYAKRQITWFKRNEETLWFAPKETKRALLHIESLL